MCYLSQRVCFIVEYKSIILLFCCADIFQVFGSMRFHTSTAVAAQLVPLLLQHQLSVRCGKLDYNQYVLHILSAYL
jgi:hypothetical protein